MSINKKPKPLNICRKTIKFKRPRLNSKQTASNKDPKKQRLIMQQWKNTSEGVGLQRNLRDIRAIK